jgi:hypothetical protein
MSPSIHEPPCQSFLTRLRQLRVERIIVEFLDLIASAEEVCPCTPIGPQFGVPNAMTHFDGEICLCLLVSLEPFGARPDKFQNFSEELQKLCSSSLK